MGKLVMAYNPCVRVAQVNAVIDSNDGVNMGFPHYVSCGEQGLFDPLRGTILYRVGRVNRFSCHPGVFMISYDGYINYS